MIDWRRDPIIAIVLGMFLIAVGLALGGGPSEPGLSTLPPPAYEVLDETP